MAIVETSPSTNAEKTRARKADKKGKEKMFRNLLFLGGPRTWPALNEQGPVHQNLNMSKDK